MLVRWDMRMNGVNVRDVEKRDRGLLVFLEDYILEIQNVLDF
jgi:hypothetical protein